MLYRFTLDLAIPESVYDSISDTKKKAFRDAVRAIKAYAVKINKGEVNEEMTLTAKWHKCRHDTNEACDEAQEI